MSTYTCHAKDIYSLNESKEYTLLATKLLEEVLTDPSLNAQSAKLWQILYNKSRFDNNLEVSVSYQTLAKQLGKSYRTILRYIKTLQKNCYLEIKVNHNHYGGRIENTLLVRFPLEKLNKIKTLKNRRQLNSDMDGNDNIVSRDSDIIDSTNNNIKINKTNNNNVVISLPDHISNTQSKNSKNNKIISESNNRDNKLSNNITNLRNELLEINSKLKVLAVMPIPKNKSDYYDHMKTISELESHGEIINMKILRLESCKEKILKKNMIINKINTDETAISKISGDRSITKFHFKRLKKELISYGICKSHLPTLLNEIIFSIRFGNLIHDKNNNTLSINHAISICLKLVRENRWETPREFVSCVNKLDV